MHVPIRKGCFMQECIRFAVCDIFHRGQELRDRDTGTIYEVRDFGRGTPDTRRRSYVDVNYVMRLCDVDALVAGLRAPPRIGETFTRCFFRPMSNTSGHV